MLKQPHFERLFITEKLNVALTLATHLGTPRQLDGYLVVGRDALTWCQGHLLELCMPEDYSPRYKTWAFGGRQGRLLPIIPRTWRKKPTTAGRSRLPVIEQLIRRTAVVVHAGDPDREGQLIVDEVLRWLGYDGQVTRLRLLGMDRASIDTAFAAMQPNSQFVALGTAAQKRGEADWTLGINASRTFTIGARRQAGFHKVISVGRVQTPTLALVAKRDQAIAEFRSAPYFQVVTALEADGVAWKAVWRPPPGLAGLDSEGRLTDLATARAVATLLDGAAGKISAQYDGQIVHPPPLPFNLSALQIACSAAFDFSPKRTLVVVQQLYDTFKVATYPRTDCRYLPESQLAAAGRLLATLGAQLRSLSHALSLADPLRPSRAWDDRKLGAHHAIVPTGAGEVEGLPADALRVYQRIALRYVMQFAPPLRLCRHTLEATLEGTFLVGVSATGVIDHGWSALEEAPLPLQPPTDVPALAVGTGVRCTQAQVRALATKPPAHYTEGELIRAMTNVAELVEDAQVRGRLREAAGLGTEATRADILNELYERGYLVKEASFLRITPFGRELIRGLPGELTKPDLTAEFEGHMQAVERGADSDSAAAFLQQYNALAAKLVERVRGRRLSPFRFDDVVLGDGPREGARWGKHKPGAVAAQTRLL